MDPTPAELAMLPALAPPPGVVPNFVNPYSILTTINIELALCVALATVTTSVRVYTKLFIMKQWVLEDYIIIVAWAGFVAYEGLNFATGPYGSGVHQWNVNIPTFITFVQKARINEIVYSPVMFLAKYAILLQYIRIFVPNHKSTMFYVIYAIIAIIGCFYTSSFFFSIFQCVPTEKLWDPTLPGYCINYPATLIVVGFFNLCADFVIILLPMIWIWRLKMSTRRKLGVSSIFAFGAFACSMSILRVVLSVQYNENGDATYSLTAVGMAINAEIAAGIMVANLPVLPRFFTHYGPKLVSVFTSYRSFGNSVTSVKEISKNSAPRRSAGIPSIKNQKTSMEPHLLEAQGSYFELDERDNKSAPSFGSGEM